MARIVLVMHEPLATAFAQCARHVLGREPDLHVVDVPADTDTGALEQQLLGLFSQQPATPVLVLCDIFGATPFNVANQARKKFIEKGGHAHLITGTNLCMVLKALTEKDDNPEQLSEAVRQGALRGVINANDACC
jgi:PTS system ascorbate-specific IIA component